MVVALVDLVTREQVVLDFDTQLVLPLPKPCSRVLGGVDQPLRKMTPLLELETGQDLHPDSHS